jgi:ribosomal protein S18 acetylase RimI-like enzyme
VPIRRAVLSDARAIAEVQVSSWKAAYHGLMPQTLLDNLQVDARQERWESILADNASRTFVFEADGSVVGFAGIDATTDEDSDKENVGEIRAIYLAPNVWRKGYGRRLVDTAIESLRLQGFAEVTLWVLHNNQRAIKFYESLGFQPDGTTKIDVRENNVQLHEVRYRRSLEK